MRKQTKWKQIIGFIIFWSLVIQIIVHATYLLRERDYSSVNITGFKAEKNLDIVFVGGSSTFVYWEPFRAWEEYGITSYDFSRNGVILGDEVGIIREIRKTADPKLFVFDLRSYAWDSDKERSFTINITDSMDESLNRFLTVAEGIKLSDSIEEGELLSYYFDIMRYHTNTDNLARQDAWDYINNDAIAPYKGFSFFKEHAFIKPPTDDFLTEASGALTKRAERCLTNLLTYAQDNHIEILFLAGPHIIDADIMAKYNTACNLVEKYGFTALNTNEHYAEMDLDFSTDFYNNRHVSVYGAEKYTRYVADFITAKYDFVDHRGEEGYEEWDDLAREAYEQDARTKQWIDEKIQSDTKAHELGLEIASVSNILEWYSKIRNENFTLFIATQGGTFSYDGPERLILDDWLINEDSEKDVIRIYHEKEFLYNENDIDKYEGEIIAGEANYVLSVVNGASLTIMDEECAMRKDGINVIVWDDNFNCVLDSVVLNIGEDGVLKIERRP